MRLCVIGNSHVGALKDSVDTIENAQGISSVTFFAKGSDGMKDLIADVANQSMMAKTSALRRGLELTSEGLSEIAVDDYDMFLVYGLGLYPYFRHNRFVSDALAMAHLSDTFTNTLAFHVVSELIKLTDKPLFIGHTPMKAAEEETTTEVDPNYLKNIELLNTQVVEPHCDGSVIPQPMATVCNKRFTKPYFTRGSIRMASGHAQDGTAHPETDRTHMNLEYGQLWWRQFREFF